MEPFRRLHYLFAYSSTILKLRLKICQSRPVRSNTKTHRNPVILLKHEKALPGERVPQQGSAGPHPAACIGDYPYKLTIQSALRELVPIPVPAGARSRGPVPDCWLKSCWKFRTPNTVQHNLIYLCRSVARCKSHPARQQMVAEPYFSLFPRMQVNVPTSS